jgi:GNAT superfamily N-acetyltransferase
MGLVGRAIAHSLPFGVYSVAADSPQVGFARVISDRSTFAYLADGYILEEHRGQGLATWLMQVILAHPGLQGLRRWMLATRDAHALYERFGFRVPEDAGSLMVIRRRNPYGTMDQAPRTKDRTTTNRGPRTRTTEDREPRTQD